MLLGDWGGRAGGTWGQWGWGAGGAHGAGSLGARLADGVLNGRQRGEERLGADWLGRVGARGGGVQSTELISLCCWLAAGVFTAAQPEGEGKEDEWGLLEGQGCCTEQFGGGGK